MKKILGFFLAMVVSTATLAYDAVVIVNRASPEYNLVISKVRSVFLMQNRRWANGQTIDVFILPQTSPTTQIFVNRFLNMTTNSYFDAVFEKKSKASSDHPHIVDTETDMIIKIANSPGGIGFASDIIVFNIGTGLVRELKEK